MQSKYTHIFEPLTIKHMTLKNRIVMTPMGTNYGEQNGEMSFLHINYYEQRAKGGTGLLIVENASVDSPEGSNGTTQLRIDHDSYIPRLFKLSETVHTNMVPVLQSRSIMLELLRSLQEQICSRFLRRIFRQKQVERFQDRLKKKRFYAL